MQVKIIFSTLILSLLAIASADIDVRAASATTTSYDASSVLKSWFGFSSIPSGSTATKLASALVSAESSMKTRSDDISAWSVFQTAAPSAVAESVLSSGYDAISTSDPPSWFTGLPKNVKSMILSEQSVRRSIATSVLKIKETSSSDNLAPRPTAEMVMGAIAAGAVGVAALL